MDDTQSIFLSTQRIDCVASCVVDVEQSFYDIILRCARVTRLYSKKHRFENVEIQMFFSFDTRISLIYWNSISLLESRLFSKPFLSLYYSRFKQFSKQCIGYSSRVKVTYAFVDVPHIQESCIFDRLQPRI